MEGTTVTKKGQVTIPLWLRKMFGIRSGEKIIFKLEGEKIVLDKVQANPIDDMVGLGKGIFGKSISFQRKLRAEWGS
ncbi:MAG: AbrB/MazE/SpoVT family DNA-binding domain-containing protein [Candidatus Thermoplasmatota archaeon]|nr:AbrB/MazE/SpoVT family DNA-binding domain-containing protein [Candidatus Thermoplasmatota archaeon]MBU4256181.1 AbrB/MazE/SpoVT family DNA-binding domain-containing protein [Candidatus Thermoplasmatota archaeon]MCG2826938.1 AbrB/MazE/SpoVT family DNA-binding domain-containing protein [Thermoplasmatales archaeon]